MSSPTRDIRSIFAGIQTIEATGDILYGVEQHIVIWILTLAPNDANSGD